MASKKDAKQEFMDAYSNMKTGMKKNFSKENLKSMGKKISEESKKPANQVIMGAVPIGKIPKVVKGAKVAGSAVKDVAKAIKGNLKRKKIKKMEMEEANFRNLAKSKEPEGWKGSAVGRWEGWNQVQKMGHTGKSRDIISRGKEADRSAMLQGKTSNQKRMQDQFDEEYPDIKQMMTKTQATKDFEYKQIGRKIRERNNKK